MTELNPVLFQNLESSLHGSGMESLPLFALEVCATNDNTRLVCALADFSLQVIDQEMRLLSRFHGHTDRITALQASRCDENICVTSSQEGTVKIWDLRNPSSAVASLQCEQEAFAAALNFNDTLLAVGLENNVNFFDTRKLQFSSCLGSYGDVHTNEITQLRFHPIQANLLFSGSEDGLLCCYNVSAPEADDAVVNIMNTECTVGKFGFFGPNQEGVYCISTIETISLLHFPSAQRLASFTDIREICGVDYLVDCFELAEDSELMLLCGNHDGRTQLLGLQPGNYRRLDCRFNGHTETIRASTLLPSNQFQQHRLITSAEDGRLLQYEINAQVINTPQTTSSVVHSGIQTAKYIGVGSAKRLRGNRNISFSPY